MTLKKRLWLMRKMIGWTWHGVRCSAFGGRLVLRWGQDDELLQVGCTRGHVLWTAKEHADA